MFVASYITDMDAEVMRDAFRDFTAGGGDLSDLAHGNVAALSLDPRAAFDKALTMLVDEVAEGYEVEPDAIRDGMDITVLHAGEHEGISYTIAADIWLTFATPYDSDGEDDEPAPTSIQASIVVDNFDPV